MRKICNQEQLIARAPVEPNEAMQQNSREIEELYAHWNHYDILPDVIRCLRVRSDLAALQRLMRESVDALFPRDDPRSAQRRELQHARPPLHQPRRI